MADRKGSGKPDVAARALLIAGPTASGKSALALDLAETLGGTVINADSMQVYTDLPILSAQPSAADRSRAPHRLFGTRDAAEPRSVAGWLEDAREALAEAGAAGRPALVVGGTGLYLQALTQGLSAIPPVPEELRRTLRAEAEGVPPEVLHARLAALDPFGAARLRPSDPQRVLRALEVVLATGRSIASYQGERTTPLLGPKQWGGVVLAPEPAALKARIDARFDAMLAAGALAEAARLVGRALDPALPAMRALGMPPLLRHLAGACSLKDAAAAAKRQTRAYARRQMTFARHQLDGFAQVAPERARDHLLALWTRPVR